MGGAALILLVVELMIPRVRPAWTWAATTGAFVVATTQLFPVLQTGAGMVGVQLACSATGVRSPLDGIEAHVVRVAPPLSPVTAFLATTFGGLALMAFSLIVGLTIEAVRGRNRSQVTRVEEIRWSE